MRKSRSISVIVLIVLMTMVLSDIAGYTTVRAEGMKNIKYSSVSPLDKKWNVSFSRSFDESTINKENISLVDDGGQFLEFDINLVDSKNIEIIPTFMYKPNENYNLIISDQVTDVDGKKMEKSVVFQFKTEKVDFSQFDEVIGWELGIYKESYNGHLRDERNVVNHNSDENIIKSISPSFFFFNYKNGDVTGLRNVINKDYIEKSKENGYEIIPMLQVVKEGKVHKNMSDFQKSVGRFFGNDNLEKQVIKDMVDEMKKIGAKRIIIDFEALGKSNKAGFTDFIDKLKKEAGEMEIMVCVAYPSENYYFNFLDFQNIDKSISEYLFMAYDQRSYASSVPGSIASNEWVEKGINKLLELGIENEKIVLGAPLYTVDFGTVSVSSQYNSVYVVNRVKDGAVAALYQNSDGTGKIKEITYGDIFTTLDSNENFWKVKYKNGSAWISKKYVSWLGNGNSKTTAVGGHTLTQRQLEKLKSENEGFEIRYDYNQMQNVLVYEKMDKAKTKKLKRMIWLEDETALQLKGKLIEKYGLKGIAFWRLGNEKPNFFDK